MLAPGQIIDGLPDGFLWKKGKRFDAGQKMEGLSGLDQRLYGIVKNVFTEIFQEKFIKPGKAGAEILKNFPGYLVS